MDSLHLVGTLLNRHGGDLIGLGGFNEKDRGPQTNWVVNPRQN